ncbi:MAG: DUF4416 family protein [Desulfobacterota bacterium]|nr:DUF4416 family protein [Thermodesulfobacteriota bacterium]
MGNPTNPEPVKLVSSLIFNGNEVITIAVRELIAHFGPLDFVSEIMAFDFTNYYTVEMGENLSRRIIAFESLISPELISSIKLFTNQMEAKLASKPDQRKINIDPGYINLYHLILATTKPAPHRPYLRKGVYADLTLLYYSKGFKPLPWTYPDYASDRLITIMNGLRQKYLFQLKKLRSTS